MLRKVPLLGIKYFYPRSPCGERRYKKHRLQCNFNFYPRSPCGERLHYDNYNLHCVEISIHALLAESDGKSNKLAGRKLVFLSTLSLRRATRNAEAVSKYMIFLSTLSLRRATGQAPYIVWETQISIHALLAESDVTPLK